MDRGALGSVAAVLISEYQVSAEIDIPTTTASLAQESDATSPEACVCSACLL